MKTENYETCCCCKHKAAKAFVDYQKYTWAGKDYFIPYESYSCNECGYSWMSAEQFRKSSKERIDCKRRAFGYLAPSDIQALRERHKLTLEQAAEIFGCRVERFQEYEDGSMFPPTTLDKLMRLFDTTESNRELISSLHYVYPERLPERRQPETL